MITPAFTSFSLLFKLASDRDYVDRSLLGFRHVADVMGYRYGRKMMVMVFKVFFAGNADKTVTTCCSSRYSSGNNLLE